MINYLEHVEVKVNLIYSRRGDLLIKITSPEGTVSNLTHYRLSDSYFKFKDLKDWTLMTLHLWGETAVGEWKLTLENSQLQHPNKGWRCHFIKKCKHLLLPFKLFSVLFFCFYCALLSWQGTLFDWTLILHGTTLNPLDKNRHVFGNISTSTSSPTKARPIDKTPTLNVSGKHVFAVIYCRCSM